MQPRTLLLKYVALVSVAAMFFVAGPSFAQQKGASSSEMKTKEARVNGLTLHYIELGQGTPVCWCTAHWGITARGMGSLRRSRRDID